MIRIIIGPPASGKSSLVDKLRSQGTLVFGVRASIQREIEDKTPRGIIAAPFAAAQRWLPDWLVVDAAIDAIAGQAKSTDILLEGIPATRIQAELLDQKLSEQDLRVDEIIHLHARSSVLRDRARRRRVCESCDFGSHQAVVSADGTCARCGGAITQRLTDRAERFDRRLLEHETNSVGLMQHYSDRNVVSIETSDLTEEQVWQLFIGARLKPSGVSQ